MSKSNTKIITDFTSGSVPKQLIRFSVPFMLSNALQILYSLVDMLVVGHILKGPGLSAVSTASQVFMFMTMLSMGFSTGGQVRISQLIGAGRRNDIGKVIGTLFTIVTVMGVAMTVIGLLLMNPVLTLLNTPKAAYDFAVDYMVVCSCGIIFTYGYNMVSAVMRGMGDSKHPLIFIAIASIINLVLDIIFVAYLGMGTFGAALATIIGQAFSFFYAVWFLYRRRDEFGFDFKPKSFIPEKATFTELTRLGVPFALQSCAINISMMFVNSLINDVSVEASSVFGVGVKVDDIVNKITQAFSFAVSAMVGQNIAAGKIKRIRAVFFYAMLFSAVIYAAFTAVYVMIPEAMFSLFTDDRGVIELAPVFVGAIVWGFPGMVIMRSTNGFIQGIGNARLGLIFALIDGFVMRITLSYVIGVTMGYGLFGYILGYGLAPFGTAIPGLIYFLSGIWKKRMDSLR